MGAAPCHRVSPLLTLIMQDKCIFDITGNCFQVDTIFYSVSILLLFILDFYFFWRLIAYSLFES